MLSGLRIGGKVMLVSMATTAIAMTVIVGAFIYYDLRVLETNREHRVNAQLDILSKNISAAMIFEDAVSAGELVGSLAADPSILAALVYTADNAVFAQYYSADADIGYPISQQSPSAAGGHSGFALFSRDIIVDGTKIGSITSWVSDRELSEGVTRTLWYAGTTFVLASVIAFFVSLIIQNAISGPIKYLNELSRRVTDTGDYKIRASMTSRDEVGELAQAFNSMLGYIDQRDTMLEKQVRQRTVELEKLAEEFRYRAFHDALTGLPNRSLLNENFAKAVAHARRAKNRFALLLLDLDNFKNINDTLGHDIGDELLKLIALRIASVVRAEDLVCRLGGDEFVVLAGDITSVAAIEAVACHIIETLQSEVDISGRSLKVTASIGASLYPDHGKDLVTLKRNADIAMYQSKEAGRNQYKLFESRMEESAVQKMIVQNDLRGAIEHDQLVLNYQPKIDAARNRVIGCEVLVRWNHPTQGVLMPNDFIPFAEENGLIQQVDHHVVRRACEQARLWAREFDRPIAVAVNLSGVHFRDRLIVEVLEDALTRNQLPAGLLEIELTEAVLIEDPETALSVLSAIKQLGIKVSLDDFGVGYSSLYYLRTLPVDAVKLDKSFVQAVDKNPQDRRLTKGIISLATDLGLEVVAEGVETGRQLEVLRELGCRLVQGYHYLRPVTGEEFRTWLQRPL